MEQSHLIELIRTLDKAEKEQILQFVDLPFFNQGKMRAYVVPLLDICLNHSWHPPQQRLEKKEVFASLFPSQTFIEGKLEKIMVEAHKVVRTVLVVCNYLREENEFHQIFDFSEIARTRGLDARYQQLLAKLQKMQEGDPWKNAPYFYRQFLLEKAKHDEETIHNHVKGDLNIPNVIHALSLHYYLNHLAMLNFLLLQQKAAKVEVPESLKSQLGESLLPELYLEESPALRANHTIFNLLKKDRPEPNDIRSLFDFLKLHEKNFDKVNLQEFYSYLRSLCILVLSADIERVEIEDTLHELYKDNLERGYLHYEGKLHPSRYWAVSSNAVRVNDFDWAIEFIEKYKHEIIGENESRDIYRLNLANYLFGKGRFSESLDNIPATSPYVDYLLAGKRLEIKAYYELKSDLLSFRLEAFKVFLSRTSPKLLSEAHKQNHVDFANLLTQISVSIPGDHKRAERVIKRLQEKKQSAEWRWLLEKAKALKEG